MAAGAPLIPEGALGIAALADLVIALLDILALGVLLGLLWTYKHTFGALIEFLVKHTTIHTPIGSFSLLFPLDAANNFVIAAMGQAALGLEIAGGRFFHALGVIFGWMVNLFLYTATTMEGAFSWFKHVHIPRYAKWAIRAAFPLAWLTKLIAQQIAKALPKVGHIAKYVVTKSVAVVEKIPRALERRLTRAEKKIAAALAAIAALGGAVIHPGHILTLPKTWRALTRRLARLERRMHRAEGWLAAGTLAVVMAQVLGVTARCLRSGNVGKTARRLCGLDSSLLDFLLADLLAIAGIVSVVEFAEALQEVEAEAVSIMGALVKEWPS
jgi:hypothetical protein